MLFILAVIIRKIGKFFFSIHFLNKDFSLNILPTDLKNDISILDIIIEGIVSHFFYLGLRFFL